MQMVLAWKWNAVTSVVHCVTISLFSATRRPLRVFLHLPSPPLPAYHRGIQKLSRLHPWGVLYTDASYQSDKSWWPRHRADINRWAIELYMAWHPG